FGESFPTTVEPPHHVTRRASTVRDANADIRTRFQHAAADKGRGNDRVIENDTKTVEKPVTRIALSQKIILRLWMKEQYRTHGFRCLEEWQKLWLIPLLTV